MNRSPLRELIEKEGIASLLYLAFSLFLGDKSCTRGWNKRASTFSRAGSCALDFRTGANSPVLFSTMDRCNSFSHTHSVSPGFSALDQWVSRRKSRKNTICGDWCYAIGLTAWIYA